MSILLQKKNVGDYSYMSSPNIYYRAFVILDMMCINYKSLGCHVDTSYKRMGLVY